MLGEKLVAFSSRCGSMRTKESGGEYEGNSTSVEYLEREGF